jgi:hypothetical protein
VHLLRKVHGSSHNFVIEYTMDGVSNCVSDDDSEVCKNDVENYKQTLTMGAVSSNGYADIVVTKFSKHCDGVSSIATCKAQATWRHETKENFTLDYDGKSYFGPSGCSEGYCEDHH